MRAGRAVNAMLCVLVGAAGAGCEQRIEKVVFLLPNGFRGVVLVTDTPGKTVVHQSNGEVRITVPPDQVARVPQLEIFHNWHNLQGEYEDGTSILEAAKFEEGNGLASNTVAIWHGASVDKRSFLVFIGTRDDRAVLGTMIDQARLADGTFPPDWVPPRIDP